MNVKAHTLISPPFLVIRATRNLQPATSLPLADQLAASGPAAEALTGELLARLVALNHDRAGEEKRGLIRWLRPDYQNPGSQCATGVPVLRHSPEGDDGPVFPVPHRQDAGGTLQPDLDLPPLTSGL